MNFSPRDSLKFNQSTKNMTSPKHSKFERHRRKLNQAAIGNRSITDYFHLTDREELLLNENSKLREIIESYVFIEFY